MHPGSSPDGYNVVAANPLGTALLVYLTGEFRFSLQFLGSLIRLDTLNYAGLRGEGSIPVPLPPPLRCSPLYPIVRIDSKNN